MWNLKRNDTNELITKQKQTNRLGLWLPGGKNGVKDTQGIWDGHVHTAVFKIDSQQGPTVQHMKLYFNVIWQHGWKRSLGDNGYM